MLPAWPSSAAGFMQVPGSGVCVAIARAAGVELRFCDFITRCGVGVGLVDEFGCWSGGAPFCGTVAPLLAGSELSGSGVLPVVPMVEVEGCVSFWPVAPVVEVVLFC